jgi:DNA-binding response OmpR family regulator
MKVLIVEDEVLYSAVLSATVSAWGHEVVTAETGQKALESVLFQGIDVLLIDVFWPDSTALDLIPKLISLYPETRLIALTGQGSHELERRLRLLGVSHCIAKPFQSKELQRVLNQMARRLRVQAGGQNENGPLPQIN